MANQLEIKRFAGEITRQADVTPYTAQDVVGSSSSGTIISYMSPVSAMDLPESGLIVSGQYQIKNLKLTKSSNTTTNATFDCYLYSSGVIESYHDNQEFGLLYTDKHVRIGKVSFTLATAGTSNSTCAEYIANDVNFTFVANASLLYFQLVATAAYTPTASEKFYLEAEIIKIA